MSAPAASTDVPDRKEAARVEILEAAAEVIAERGFHGMSMRELSRSLGRSLAGFYNYFASKEELLHALQTRALLTLIASATEATDGVEEPAARLYSFILSHVRYVATHHAAMQVLVQEAGALDEAGRRDVREIKERYFDVARRVVTDVVKNGCAAQKGRPDIDEQELERLTYSLFGMLNWTYGWYRPEQHGSPRELAKSIQSLAVCGLASSCAQTEACHDIDVRFADRKLRPLLSLRTQTTSES